MAPLGPHLAELAGRVWNPMLREQPLCNTPDISPQALQPLCDGQPKLVSIVEWPACGEEPDRGACWKPAGGISHQHFE